jgi:hypothetical protein
MEMGERPMEAALNGSREIDSPCLDDDFRAAVAYQSCSWRLGGRLLHEFA